MTANPLNWRDEYEKKLKDARDIFSRFESGSRIFVGGGCAVPRHLVEKLLEHSEHLSDCEIVHFLTFGEAPYTDRKYAHRFRHNSYFIGGNVREAVSEGDADYTPIHLSQIERLFQSRRVPLDYALINVAPPDEYGYVNLGISVDVARSAVACAKKVIAQVNAKMPRCRGEGFLHVSDIDFFVERDEELIEFHHDPPTAREQEIGRYIARLIDDGATIQVGYGATPAVAIPYLEGKATSASTPK